MVMAYVLAFLKYVIYGSTVFFTGELEKSTDVLDILALRFLVSFVFIWLLKTMGVFKIKFSVREFFGKSKRKNAIKGLLIASLFEPVLYMFFETLGISMTTDITTAVIISLTPITNCIAEIVFLRERCSFLEKVFLFIGIAGVIYIATKTSSGDGKDSVIGIAFLLLAVISGSLFSVFSRKSSKYFSPMEITYAATIMGALIFNVVNIIRHIVRGDIIHYFKPYLSLNNMVGFLFLGVLSAVLGTAMNNYCLSKIQLSTIAAFSGVSTLVTILIGVIFKNEQLYYFHYIGLALIISRMIGVSTLSVMRNKKTHPCKDKNKKVDS